MSLIKINGINLDVNVTGWGQPLILIHGVGGDQSLFDGVVDQLALNYKVITYDCRGHGESDKPKQYALSDHTADVLAIVDHFQIDNTYLNGVSMGSYIAQGVAIAAPQRIGKLILTVPKSNGLTSSVQRLFTEHAKQLAGLSQHQSIVALLKYMVYDAQAMLKHINIFETNLPPAQFYAANKALSGFDFRNDLNKITAKTLVISGKYDGLNPPAEGELCAQLIPNATFVEMQYSGHAPMHEEPVKYLGLIEDFMRG